ncbi:MAG: plastocyanin/azurin family copper-binding protein [Halanaeroarchaeum sp.]
MDRREFLAAGVATLGTAVAGCLGREGLTYDVAMVSDAFVPGSTASVPATAPKWVPRGVPTVRIQAGETVVWENTGSRIHTVTAATRDHGRALSILGSPTADGGGDHEEYLPRLPDGAAFFASGRFRDEVSAVENFVAELNGGGAIPPGEQYRHRFSVPGWYHYYCIPHEPAGMMGNVHVVP